MEKVDYNTYEDPARSWIDLVLAFKAGQPPKVREVLAVAKQSHWNHDLFNTMLQDTDDFDTEDEMGSDPEGEL